MEIITLLHIFQLTLKTRFTFWIYISIKFYYLQSFLLLIFLILDNHNLHSH